MKVILVLLAVATLSPHLEAATNADGFSQWKVSFLKRWGKREVPKTFMREHLDKVDYNPKVVKIDKNQVTSDKKLDFKEWMERWLNSSPPRISTGKQMLKKYKTLLGKIEKKYGVDKEAIIALWGVETLYGEMTGNYNVVQALSTLAFEGRRKKFFETQLFTALKILHQGHIAPEKFLGSWSGALGQVQFMPSSFTRIAVDYDGDKKRNIWESIPDSLASIANYLKRAKWKNGKSVGTLAFISTNKAISLNQYRSTDQYNKLGFRTAEGNKLVGHWKRKGVKVPLKNGPYVLKGSNYMSIMRWNNSSLFAALVITLMDAF